MIRQRILFAHLVAALVVLSLSAGPGAQRPLAASQTQAEPSAGEFVGVNGAGLWYRTEGQGEPLLLIPGGPGDSHDVFVPMFSSLATTARLVYFDPFGRGKSERATSSSDYSLARDVEDVEGLRVALGLGPMNLLGHSYGGIVAQAYALKYPASVRRLILSSTLHRGTGGLLRRLARVPGQMIASDRS